MSTLSLSSPHAPLRDRLPPVRGRVSVDHDLSKITWFRVGGPAEVFFKPADADDLATMLRGLPADVPVTVLGVGSNLLVRDGGIPGLVIRLGRAFAEVSVSDTLVSVGAAALDVHVAQHAADAGLSGLEFLSGIPGTIGGALRMNAGAYGHEIADVLVSATAVDRAGQVHTLTPAQMQLSYRHCGLPEDWIFVSAVLRGAAGDRAAIAARMAEIKQSREDSQPVRARTGGSTFANPPGFKAWQLVDDAGCRGLTIGGAQVSEKHCNFLLNTGSATAHDLETLGETVRQRVLENSGVSLRWEIRRLGVAAPPAPMEAPAMTSPLSSRIDRSRAYSVVSADAPHNTAAQQAVAEAKARRKVRTVAVLLGGLSAEREVSLNSGANAVHALEQAGYKVKAIDVSRDIATLIHDLQRIKPDVVFNALHGRYGEDGCIQGILNILGLPYTHSGLLASALAMDKPAARLAFEQAGMHVAVGKVVTREEVMAADPLPRPYVVKPLNEGSSVGVAIIREGDNAPYFAHNEWPYGEQVLAEAFIPGREFTVAVMDKHALGVTEIHTDRTFYDYDAKYAAGGSVHTLPADIEPELYAECQRLAICAHDVLGCRGVSRTDLRYDGKTLYLLEVNTQPGMTRTSLVPEQGELAGISFADLCTWMVETAECDA